MDAIELYRLWAPDDSIWSAWAKPLLFADRDDSAPVDSTEVGAAVPPPDVSWAPGATNGTAIVLDLPGPQAIAFGLGR
jgi:hypothetical protein